MQRRSALYWVWEPRCTPMPSENFPTCAVSIFLFLSFSECQFFNFIFSLIHSLVYFDVDPWEHVVGMGLGAVFVNQLLKWEAQVEQDLDKMLEKAKAANERRYIGFLSFHCKRFFFFFQLPTPKPQLQLILCFPRIFSDCENILAFGAWGNETALDWSLQWLLWIVRFVGERKREALHMSALFELNHDPLLSILELDWQVRFRVF